MRAQSIVLLLIFGLCAVAPAACGRKAAPGGLHAGSPVAKLVGRPVALNAGGEAPGWTATVRGGVLRLEMADAAPLTVKTALSDHGAAGAVWSGVLPGRPDAVTLSIQAKPCQDAVTGIPYPLTAVAQMRGARFGGCAARPGQGLGPRT